jgi:hypothetical protein
MSDLDDLSDDEVREMFDLNPDSPRVFTNADQEELTDLRNDLAIVTRTLFAVVLVHLVHVIVVHGMARFRRAESLSE